jgi:redox-sensitive bicupin YhaK (pirin superfamily)
MIEAEGASVRLIGGTGWGRTSPVETPMAMIYADASLRAGASLPFEPTYDERAIYTVQGEIDIRGDRFGPGQLLVFRPGDAITVTAVTDARFMLLGGEPMDGPRHIWWNFVSSRKERIEQAKEDWKAKRFDTVPGDELEFIPLPNR